MSVVQTLIGNVKGPQGATGATGATGPQGDAATINVGSVSTTAYGNPAQVVNVGTENEAILNFVIPQGRPGQATTTMGDLILDTITTSTASFPSPAVNDTGAVAFGKIRKFFADTLNVLTNNLVTKKQLVIITDSFGVSTETVTAFTDLIETMGVYDRYQKYAYVANGGSGFATGYQNQLYDLVDDVTGVDDDKVYTVLAVAGTNDAKVGSTTATEAGIALFATNVRAKFPNVKQIIIAYDAHVEANHYSYPNFGSTYPSFITACAANGIELVNMINFCRWSELGSDGMHPTQIGQNKLAMAVLSLLDGARSWSQDIVQFSVAESGVSGFISLGSDTSIVTLNINVQGLSTLANFARIKNVAFSEDIYLTATPYNSSNVVQTAFLKIAKDGYLTFMNISSLTTPIKAIYYGRFSVPNYMVTPQIVT